MPNGTFYRSFYIVSHSKLNSQKIALFLIDCKFIVTDACLISGIPDGGSRVGDMSSQLTSKIKKKWGRRHRS